MSGYLARIVDRAGCHMPRGADWAPTPSAGLSGGSVGSEIQGLAIFWPRNLTPDATGLGGWTKTEVVDAIRTGVRPDGRVLAPVMPWPNCSILTDEDAAELAADLLSTQAVANKVPEPFDPKVVAAAPFYRVMIP